MGVERSVTRWYLQRQLTLNEITQLEVKQASISAEAVEPGERSEGKEDPKAVDVQLSSARRKLKALGSCPKPMMG